MKKFTALIAAAILAFSMSLPVFAEPVDDSDGEFSVVESSVVESSDISDESLPELSGYTPKIYYTSYPIPEAEMYIDLPNDMHVLSKNIDENSPALKACKITKAQLLKSFEQTGNYIKASSKDFTYDITVNILQNKSTRTIDNLATLDDEDIKSIVDNTMRQQIYTSWSKNIYNNSLYLSFPIQFNDGNKNIAGIQQYTIVKGTRIVITFQSYTGEIDDTFSEIISSVMESIVFDGINPHPEISEQSEENVSVNNLDIRYIYLLLSALIALIFLTLIITTAMIYKKSHSKKLPEPVTENTSKDEAEKEDIKLPEKDDIPQEKEISEDTDEQETPQNTEINSNTDEKISESITEKSEPDEENISPPIEEKNETAQNTENTEIDEIDENHKEEKMDLPSVPNQLELVEIAFRIIPILTHEDEDLTEIWNFIYKKFDDIEYFSNYSNQNTSNANAFYKINSQSDIPAPAKSEHTIDDEIRKETLETVVGDNKPETLKFDEQQPQNIQTEDLNELIYATPPTYPETEPESEPETEPEIQTPTNTQKNDEDAKIKPMQTSEMKLGTPPKRPKNEIYKAKEENIKNQNIQLEISRENDGSIKIGANNGEKSLDVEIEKHKKNKNENQ